MSLKRRSRNVESKVRELHDDRINPSKRQHISEIPPPTIPYLPPLIRHKPSLPQPLPLRARLPLILTHILQNRIIPLKPSHVSQSDPPPRTRTRRLPSQTHIQKRYSTRITFSSRTRTRCG